MKLTPNPKPLTQVYKQFLALVPLMRHLSEEAREALCADLQVRDHFLS